MDSTSDSATRLLQELRGGRREALDELIPLVYGELHRLARIRRSRWRGDDTLDTTALLHETYLRLARQSAPVWEDRAHFLAVASRAMRQVLLDYAKRRLRTRRGGGVRQLPLDDLVMAPASANTGDLAPETLIALDAALHRLAERDERQSRIVECRFYGGMSIEDTARALGISPATVKRGWAMAQAWLFRDLTQSGREAM